MPCGLVAPASPAGAAAPVPVVPDYELLRRVGAGAYGEIWLARSLATGALRAAKIVWRHNFEDDRPFQREFEGIQRFERISREHPSQLALFHIGRNEAAGYFYYIIELADAVENPDSNAGLAGAASASVVPAQDSGSAKNGGLKVASEPEARPSDRYVPHTLRYDLDRERLAPAKVVEIGLALTEALVNLHGHGLVHRDVKPSNVIFLNGRPKLADIGLVTAAGEGGSIVGTEGYLAPEGPGTPQADLFALGKVLYEGATGLDRRRFPRLPADLRSWPNAKLVLELNEVVVKACAASPSERYQTAEEMRSDLELLKIGRSVKHLRLVERRLAILTRAAVLVSLCVVAASGIFYETYRQRQVALSSLVRLHVANGTHLLNEGDLFGSLLSYTEALRLDAGTSKREESHRIRIASVLRECPRLVGMFAHSNAPINDAAFSPDNLRVITASDDHTAQAWLLATGERQFVLMHTGAVISVAFSPSGDRIATTSSDGLVHLWKGKTGEPIQHERMRHRSWNNGPPPQFSPAGGQLLTLPDLHTVGICDAITGEPVGKPLRHKHEVSSYSFSPDSRRILTLSSDRSARLWDAITGELLFPFTHEANVNCGAFDPTGRLLATGGDDNCARLWDLLSGKEVGPLFIHRNCVDSVAFSPDGTRLATACRDRTVELWDITTNRALLRPVVHERRVLRTEFSPDGRLLVSCSEGNRVRLWDADTGELRAPPFVHDTPRRPVIFSRDGHLLLTLRHDLTLEREEVAAVWDLARGESPILRIRPPPSFRKTISSPDARFKAVVSGDTVRTIASDSGKPMTQPLKQSIPFRQVCFSRDDTVLLTESAGGRGQLWDLSRGEPLTPMLRVTYDREARAPARTDLPRDGSTIEDLLARAQLLSGNRVDETGGFLPVDWTLLIGNWKALRRKSPDSFNDSPVETLTWHEKEAGICEQTWNWWSARFHLQYLVAAHPGDLALEHRLAYAQLALQNANAKPGGYFARRFLAIPPRNPQASAAMIDLSSYYNLSRRAGDNSLASMPSGLQTFGGACFDVRAVVQLSDSDDAAALSSFPKQVCDIPVRQRCDRMHFLHATAGQAEDGTEVSKYIVHYADRGTQTITNFYGRDVRSWWTDQGESVTAERSAVVWMGTNPQAQSDNARSLRMFKSTWENPRPDVEIATVDFVSVSQGVRPFLVAMTAEVASNALKREVLKR